MIIPTLNEADHLPGLLVDLHAQQKIRLEMVVGDGGSRDATVALARTLGARVLKAPLGRGRQMNRAAARARSPYLLFLHADSRLPDPFLLAPALAALKAALNDSPDGAVAGHFPLRFQRTRQDHAWTYRFMEAKTHLNRVNTTNGDQGLLLSRTFFNQLGGFAESLAFLEDQELAEKIRRRGRWITLPGTLVTSARRFEAQGVSATYLLMSLIMGAYSTGLRPFFTRLPDVYRAVQRKGSEEGRLYLSPYFKALRAMHRKDLPGWAKIRAWQRIGGYIRSNIWQVFFYLDVRTHPEREQSQHPWLDFYDRHLVRCLANPIVDAVLCLSCFLLVFGLIAPYYSIIESRQQKDDARWFDA